MKIDLKLIEQRKNDLENAKKELKKHFIGIDTIIDDLMDYIQIWYLMPEILNRPIIVNLWGMTGVGKTDLVRKLVKCLNYQDRFAEVELSNVDSTTWHSSVSAVLERNNMNDDKPSIVLFDEIQRFYTIDQDGKPLQSTKFMDFWELLSDGKLSKKDKEDLDYYINDFLFSSKDMQRRKQRGEEGIEDNPSLSFYEAQNLKRMLTLDLEVDEISDLTRKDMFEMIVTEKKKKKIYEPVDHAKTLIIISGNLDEAFEMARQTSEADVDADIFFSYTEKVTVVDIKNALTRKFRPEQVARFGNIHLIYTSLKKVDFETLIEREIARLVHETKDKFGIKLKVAPAIYELIYRNGVFPVQGVRPVFSSVVDILETNLSKFLFTALMGGSKSISIDYSFKDKNIIARVGSEKILVPYVGRIDKIRERNHESNVASISVHESGHALVYMLLFGLAPLQLKSKVASSYAGGFTFPHQIYETKENMLHKIKIYLAGGIAEEIIFGKQHASVGRSHDREQATALTIDFIRKYGFDKEFQATYTLEYSYAMDKTVTDTDIEKMITRMVAETQELIVSNQGLLRQLSTELCLKGSLTAQEVADLAAQHNLHVLVSEEHYLHIADYDGMLKAGK
jgi:cell division protease FtsH